MRILMIAATPFFSDRGCHIRIYNEIKYLQKNGIDVNLCTYHLGKNVNGIKIKRSVNIPWYKKITPGASWHKLYLDFFLLLTSYKEYLKLKPKIIHAHLYESLCIAYAIKILSLGKVKIVFDCQGSLAEEMYHYTLYKNLFLKLFYKLFKIIEKTLLYFPDKILCSSENSYNFLVNNYKIRKNKIDILNDRVDKELFMDIKLKKVQNLREEFKVPQTNKIIIYTGSITDSKGVGNLVKNIPKIIEKNHRITFLFVGYGDDLDKYKKKLHPYIKSKNIIFTGRINYFDLPLYLKLADFAIDPKRETSESSGKLLNYMATELPIICFKSNSNFKILKNKGIYIRDFSEISNKISKGSKKYVSYDIPSWNRTVNKLVYEYQNIE